MSLILLGTIKGFSLNTITEVNKNFHYEGDLLIADKFLDPMMNINGQQGTSGIIMKVMDGEFIIVVREFTFEYDVLRSQTEIGLGGKRNTINFMQYNMHLFPDYSFNEVKNYINLVLFADNATTPEDEIEE